MRIIALKSPTRVEENALKCTVCRIKELGFSGPLFYADEPQSRLCAEHLEKSLGLFIHPLKELSSDNSDESRSLLSECLGVHTSRFTDNTDTLLVFSTENTHKALCEIYHPVNYKSSVIWDLSLTLLFSSDGESYVNDASHIPPECRYANEKTYVEHLAAIYDDLALAERFARKSRGRVLLHIGDTHSAHSEFYKELIFRTRPSVIIHTGDFADELKAGRVESSRPAWRLAASHIIDIMKSSGARLIAVAGNNDVEEMLLARPELEMYEPNTVLDISGSRICLTHEVWRIDESISADLYMYGHGPTGDERTPYDNEREGRLYFNAFWGASLHCPEENRHLILRFFNI